MDWQSEYPYTYCCSSADANQALPSLPPQCSNSFVKYMVNGTQINEALDIGKRKNGQDCGDVYKDCKLDKDMVLQMFKKLM